MTTYVALLRGVNVGGHRKLPMADLRALLETLKCDNVRTYLQSGNAVFTASGAQKAVQTRVARAIAERFYDDVPVLLRSAAQLDAVVENNPYAAASKRAPKLVHAVFMSAAPKPRLVDALTPFKTTRERVAVVGDVLYLDCPDGYGQTKLTPTVMERVLGVTATARNWQTVMALQAMMAEAPRP
jgi:uncharacterized protein (DUF1697 family)